MGNDLITRMLKEFGGCGCELCAERMSRAAAVCQEARDAEWRSRVKKILGALKLVQPILADELQSRCESYCPPCKVGERYDYSALKEPELGWITGIEAALDAVEAAISQCSEQSERP